MLTVALKAAPDGAETQTSLGAWTASGQDQRLCSLVLTATENQGGEPVTYRPRKARRAA